MKTSKTTIIDAPAKIVFLWLEDKDRLRQWIPSLVEDEPLVETPEKIGSKFRQVYLENGKEMEMTGEITAYVQDECLRAYITGKMFDLDVDYILKSTSDTQTELTQDSEIKLKGFFKVMWPLMALMSKLSKKDPQAEAHARLKEMAEAEFKAGELARLFNKIFDLLRLLSPILLSVSPNRRIYKSN